MVIVRTYFDSYILKDTFVTLYNRSRIKNVFVLRLKIEKRITIKLYVDVVPSKQTA